MIQQYPPQIISGGGGSAAVPVNSYIIGSSTGPNSLVDGTCTYLKTGVIAVASAYPAASTVVCTYPVSSIVSPNIQIKWMAGNTSGNTIVGIQESPSIFVYSTDGGVTYTPAGDNTNGTAWTAPMRMFWSAIFSRFIAFGNTGRWTSTTGASWSTAGANEDTPMNVGSMQYAEGGGKGIAVTSATGSSSPKCWVTSNGTSWTAVSTPNHFQDITFHSVTSSFYALGMDGYIYRSTAGGTTWAVFNNTAVFGNWIYSDGTKIYCISGATIRTSSDNANTFVSATLNCGVTVSYAGYDVASKTQIGPYAVIYTAADGNLITLNGTQNAPVFNVGTSSGCAPCFTSTNGYLGVSGGTTGPRTYTLSPVTAAVDNWKQIDGTGSAYNYSTLYKRVA